MRKLMTVLGIMFFASALALPVAVFAMGPGMGGGGYGMMGSWGPGSAYCNQGGWYNQQQPNQGHRGQYNQEPNNQPAPNNRSGREYFGGPNSYERGTDGYGNYGQIGGFGMGWGR
jgi:hypothetical protein